MDSNIIEKFEEKNQNLLNMYNKLYDVLNLLVN